MTSGLQGNALAKNAIQTHICAGARAHTHTHTHTHTKVCQTRDDYPKTHMGKHAVQTKTINKHTILIISHKSKYMLKALVPNSIQTTKHENIPQMQKDFVMHFHIRN